MKTTLMIVASLALGTAAIAQDAKTGTETAPSSTASPTPDAAAGMTPSAPMNGTGQTAAPAPMTPAPDASAMPAPATTSTPDAAAMPAPTAAADDSSLPMCSRTVTDKCKQHEGGAHKMMRKKHK